MNLKKKPLLIIIACILTAALSLTTCLAFAAFADDMDRKYTVTVEANGGSAVTFLEQLNAIEQEPLTTRAGFAFGGWFTTADFSDTRISFPLTLTKDITLFAKWNSLDVIHIKTEKDLASISSFVIGKYVLDNNITVSDKFVPIGTQVEPFSGTFDGNGYTISGLNFKDLTEDKDFNHVGIGLFGWSKGNISNVNVDNFKVVLEGNKSRFHIGAVVGYVVGGNVINCHSTGNITNLKIVYEEGFLDDFLGSYATPTSRSNIGGVVGMIETGNITKCSSTVTISSKSYAEQLYLGGVVGYNSLGVISGCRANSTVSGGRYAGGLVGFNNGKVEHSYAITNVSTDIAYPTIGGGLIAYCDGASIVNTSYALGTINSKIAGGLVGVVERKLSISTGGIIENCFANATVNGNTHAGGLVGMTRGAKVSFSMSFGVSIADNAVWEQDPANKDDPTALIKVYKSYAPTYAGGIVAEDFESTFSNCLSFGNISALSLNKFMVYNNAYANNGVGHTSKLVAGIWGIERQTVTRNNVLYGLDSFNSSPSILYSQANNYSYLVNTLKFSNTIWNLVGLDIEEGNLPTLK